MFTRTFVSRVIARPIAANIRRPILQSQSIAYNSAAATAAAAAAPMAALRVRRHFATAAAGAPVTAAMVKVLRDRTGAGLMDCKHALAATADAPSEDERMTRAAEWLRKKGVSVAQKKSGRLAAQGLVGLALSSPVKPTAGALVEVNSETDFVARNARFQRLVADIALSALALPVTSADPNTNLIPVATVAAAPLWNNSKRTVGDLLLDTIGSIKENLQIRRVARINVQPPVGSVFGYVHSQVEKADPTTADAALVASDSKEAQSVQMGRIGSLVAISTRAGSTASEVNSELGAALTMHIVASAPQHLSRSAVPAAAIEKERELIRAAAVSEHQKKSDAAVAAGKAPLPPLKSADKLVDGKLKKWLQEQILNEQTFVSPDASSGSDSVEKVLTAAGVNATGFARFSVGEGLNPLGAAAAK